MKTFFRIAGLPIRAAVALSALIVTGMVVTFVGCFNPNADIDIRSGLRNGWDFVIGK